MRRLERRPNRIHCVGDFVGQKIRAAQALWTHPEARIEYLIQRRLPGDDHLTAQA